MHGVCENTAGGYPYFLGIIVGTDYYAAHRNKCSREKQVLRRRPFQEGEGDEEEGSEESDADSASA